MRYRTYTLLMMAATIALGFLLAQEAQENEDDAQVFSHLVTPDVDAAWQLGKCFSAYSLFNDGKHPDTWDELITFAKETVPDAFKLPEEYLDVRNRYQLFSPPLTVRFSLGGEHKVLAMAINGTLPEGMSGRPEGTLGRKLIVQDVDGKIRGMGSDEERLRRDFEKSGLDLADYTKPTPPGTAQPVRNREKGANNKRRPDSHPDSPGNQGPSNLSSAPGPTEGVGDSSPPRWALIAGIALFLVAIAVWLKSHVKKPS